MRTSLATVQQVKGKPALWMIPVFEGKVAAAAKQYGFDARQASDWGFSGRVDQLQQINLRGPLRNALLIGAGPAKDFNAEKARQTIAKGLRRGQVGRAKSATALFVGAALASSKIRHEDLVEALAEGAILGGYAFTQLKGTGTKAADLPQLPSRVVVAMDRLRKIDRERFGDGSIMAEWTNWGRDLLNQSQSHVSATKLAAHARRAAKGLKRVRCTVLGMKEIAAAKMGLLLAVNQGSTEPPRFVILQYSGGRKGDKPICLIGKGVTFDTGGYNIKTGEGMRGMHMDKGGAIGTLSSFFAAVQMGVKKNLVCLVPATDNRISGTAMVPGDVFRSVSGITVEIGNTDAEGRLILADALAYAKKFAPSHVVDMATLTGAAVVALGDQASAIFCNNDAFATQLLKHAEKAGELMWRMPLWSEYDSKLKSATADLCNIGNRWGGAITAALFLQRFVPDGVKWCHIDMAGKMNAESDQPYTPAGSGHGFGPRLIGRWLRSM